MFWRKLRELVAEQGADAARDTPWPQLFALTNNSMAEAGVDSALVENTLRDIMISPSSLGGPV